jgi:hypothetical protein
VNSKLILATGAVCLFAAGGVAYGQNAPQTTPPSTQPTMQKAEVPAEPGTDTSYGGVPLTGTTAASSMRAPSCISRASCDIFHGH